MELVIGAALTAAAGVVVAYVMGWLQRLGRWVLEHLLKRVRSDHLAIRGGWCSGDFMGSSHFLVGIKCAPNRSLHRELRTDPERVAEWGRSTFGPLFPSVPDYADPTVQIRYRRVDATGGNDGWFIVWPSGLVEVTFPITHEFDEHHAPLIPITAAARPLVGFIGAVRLGAYPTLFGEGNRAQNQLRGRKLDWYVGVSRGFSTPEWTSWAGLDFPGRAPKGRATGMQAPMSERGFGYEELQNLRQDATPERILMPAFADLIRRSGYYGCEPALRDIRTMVRTLSNGVSAER